MADEDERLVDPNPSLGRQAPQPLETLLAELLVRPFRGGLDRVRHALGHPRKGSGIVAVRHGDVRIPLDYDRAGLLHLADRVEGCRRLRSVEDEVARDHRRFGLCGLDGLANSLQG